MPYAAINGQEIYFEDSGGPGFPVVFMHGFLMDQSLFDPQVERLIPKYRCVRFDARAFGKTKWDGKAFDLYDLASDCVKLMDELNIGRAAIVGMSQGGYCALRVVLKFPERVSALVLMSTTSAVDGAEIKGFITQMRDTWMNLGPIDPLIDGIAVALLGAKTEPGMQAHWDRWLPQWRKTPKENFFHAINNLNERDDVTARLGEIKCPALVSNGTEDMNMPPKLAEGLSNALPDCRKLVLFPGAHAANYTHPEIINEELRKFLDSLDLP